MCRWTKLLQKSPKYGRAAAVAELKAAFNQVYAHLLAEDGAVDPVKAAPVVAGTAPTALPIAVQYLLSCGFPSALCHLVNTNM